MKLEHEYIKRLESFSTECENYLIKNVIKFNYPEECSNTNDWVDLIKKIEGIETNKAILKMVSKKDGVYAIFVHEPRKKWALKYIGESNANNSRQRIRSHFIRRGEGVSSQLENVKDHVAKGNHIGVSFVDIEPSSLRLYVEDVLIKKHKGKLWNTRGAKGKD